jgi:tight adherence protein C
VPLYVVLAALAVVGSVPVLALAVGIGRATSQRVSRNLGSGHRNAVAATNLRQIVLARSAAERALRPLVGALARHARRLTPRGVVAALDRRLELAGTRTPVEHALLLKAALAVGVGGLGFAWYLAAPSTATLALVPAAVLLGYTLPDARLARQARARQLAVVNELPDTLDQMTICVEAGLGFDAALNRVARTSRGVLGGELRRMLQDVQLGLPRGEALDNLAARSDVAELRQFVHAILQAEKYGVPVAQVLRTQADEHREKRRSRAEERAMKIPVKLVFPLVLCILPTLFIVVLGPGLLRILHGL